MSTIDATTRRTKHWTLEEYYLAVRAGIFEGQRLELIGGEIIEMSPQESRHATILVRVQRLLENHFGKGFWVRAQLPFDIGRDSAPEPDLAVVKGDLEDYEAAHPRSSLLIAEVSETTLAYDPGEKASLYASAGLLEYWVIDVRSRTLLVHRGPSADPDARFGYRFRDVNSIALGGSVIPLSTPEKPIRIADFFGSV